MVNFGDRLKELRKRSKLSQEQLARQLGITKGMISSYETSMRMPSYHILLKIRRIFWRKTTENGGDDGKFSERLQIYDCGLGRILL